eukprot:COSAG02_NODE_8306_length_2623_cov_6.816165_2_plen_66_part_00
MTSLVWLARREKGTVPWARVGAIQKQRKYDDERNRHRQSRRRQARNDARGRWRDEKFTIGNVYQV